MRHMEICRKKTRLNTETDCTLVYYVTVDEWTNPSTGMELESFGVGVTICENGETGIVPNVTFSKTGILSLADTLAFHLVTPVTVRDVVEDWLNADGL